MTIDQIIDYLNTLELDLKIRGGNPRYFDQKVQPDVVEIISQCIKEFSKKKHFFTINDIWNNEFSENLIFEYFNKPKATDKKAENEYDKFFAQPICFLTFFGILHREKKGNKYYHTVLKPDILDYISSDQRKALNFINICLISFIRSNQIEKYFDKFFNEQDKGSYLSLREKFFEFTYQFTNIKPNNKHEPGRIFTPIINALAFKQNKKGTQGGRLSDDKIYFTDLIYARPNWKDILDGKPGELTREEWAEKKLDNIDENISLSSSERSAKKSIVTKYGNISEYSGSDGGLDTHHIFPRSYHFNLCYYKENLIRITPDEHYVKAHPNRNTQIVDKPFQVELLKAKLNSIKTSLDAGEDFYDLKLFIDMLNKGFKIDLPDNLSIDDLKNFLNSRSN